MAISSCGGSSVKTLLASYLRPRVAPRGWTWVLYGPLGSRPVSTVARPYLNDEVKLFSGRPVFALPRHGGGLSKGVATR